VTQEADTQPQAKPRRPWGKILWALLAVSIAVPVVATIVGGVTSPPNHGVPEGHLVYMEANHPSEHTSTLREMFSKGPDGQWHMLVSETEPQDVDAGSRDWISMPTVSPDATKVAYYQQNITLQEEVQKLEWQLYVLQIDPATQKVSKPKLVANLSQDKKAQYFGATWTPDSKSLVVLSDGKATSYDSLSGQTKTLAVNLPADARWPSITKDGSLYFQCSGNGKERIARFIAPTVPNTPLQTMITGAAAKVEKRPANPSQATNSAQDKSPEGVKKAMADYVREPGQGLAEVRSTAIEYTDQWAPITSFAVSRDGSRFAAVPADTTDEIKIGSWDGHDIKTLKVAYGKSIFGRRRVTAVKWSPSGHYVGYSVSKPPVGEDEVFYIDVETGAVNKLPFRTGRASWDWAP